MKLNYKLLTTGLAAIAIAANTIASPFLVTAHQPFLNPDIPSNLMMEELKLNNNQAQQLSEILIRYRQQRRALSPGYENKHRSILQGSQATDAAMIYLIVQSGHEIAGILTDDQKKKVATLAAHAEAIACTGYPLAGWELSDYSESKQNKIFEIGKAAAEKLSKLPPDGSQASRNSVVASAWLEVKKVLSSNEFDSIVGLMRQHNVPIPAI